MITVGQFRAAGVYIVPGRIHYGADVPAPALAAVSMILLAYRTLHPRSRAGGHWHKAGSTRREFPPLAAETLITIDEDETSGLDVRANIINAALGERARWKAGAP